VASLGWKGLNIKNVARNVIYGIVHSMGIIWGI
jgi:hypothetical protein